jgi:predicted transcriptional regulator
MNTEANQIRAELVRRGITVTSIAKQLGVSQPYVSQHLSNVRNTARIRQAIAAAIDQPVHEIWPEPERDLL